VTQSLNSLGPVAVPVEPGVTTKRQVTAVVGYGGPAAPYALKVHENPRSGKTGGISPRGKKYRSWATVGEWKYLEKAVQTWAPKVPEILAKHLRRAIQRLGRKSG
jgi:hypothetical protein